MRAAPSETEERERERLTCGPGGEFSFSFPFFFSAVTYGSMKTSDAIDKYCISPFGKRKKKINMFPKLHVALKIHRTKSVELFFLSVFPTCTVSWEILHPLVKW